MSEAILSWLGPETGRSFGWLGRETGHGFLETGHNMSEISIRWGLTLLHFLWQGTIIGLLAFIAARLLRSQSASVRYWLNGAALMACPICVAWTFAVANVPESWRVSSNQQSDGSLDSGGIPIETSSTDDLVDVPYPNLDPPQAVSSTDAASVPLNAATTTPATAPVAIETTTSSASEWMPVVARWIAILYAVGVVCFLVRLAIALWGGHRLRAISKPVSDSALLELIRTQAHRIGLKLVPVVAYCERVAVPTVIGVLRPMILLPATLTTGLTTDELSAILSHELAHIRRYDLWMNLLQRIIESLLFFHPVVWLLSHRLSAEREICCDDLVVRSGHQPMNYAGALLRMAELCAGISPQNSLSLAATSGGTSLLEHRVLRLIHKSPSTQLSLDRKGVLALLIGLVMALAISVAANRTTLIAIAPFQLQNESSKEVTVAGRIILEDGTPVTSEGSISIHSHSGTRSSGGHYMLDGSHFSRKCQPGRISVAAFVDGYAPAWVDEFELFEDSKDDVVLVLKPGTTKKVQVVDKGDKPITGATLVIQPEIHGRFDGPIVEQKTDESGRVELKHLADTRYQFQINASGFQKLRTDPLLVSGDNEIVQVLQRCRPATGWIFNSDGTASAAAHVQRCAESIFTGPGSPRTYCTNSSGDALWFGERIATTDANGRFELDELNDESEYMMLVQGADGSRVLLHDIMAGQTDRRITLPKRRDLIISVTGDPGSLPARDGKPFVSVRQNIPIRTATHQDSFTNMFGAEIPLELHANGGSATFQGLIVDPQGDPRAEIVEVSFGYRNDLMKFVRIRPEGETKVTFELPPAKQEVVVSKPFDEKTIDPELRVPIRYPFCVVETDNIQRRSLHDAISSFNLTSQESPTGILQPPITEQDTRDAIAKFAAEKHVPEGVRTQLEQILKSGELLSNVYFRRFTRFDDGKQMQDVWWVRLVVETGNGPVYSVPVRTTSLSARPYTQMERQQDASENLTLLNRVSTYVDEAKFRNMPSDVFISMNVPKVRDSEIDRFLEKAEAALRSSDLNALLAFHSWRETSDATREFVTAELNRLLSGTVHDVWYSPREGHQLTTWSAWQFYKPNLPVAGYLKISYSPEAGKENSSPDDHQILALELGVDEGELRLVNYIKDGPANPPQELNPGPSITGHLEPLADGTHLVTDIITNPGSLLSAHLANEEVRLRDFQK